MKYLSLFFIFLILSCSEEDAPKIECRLTKIIVKGANFEAQTVYTYNASGKMDKQVRTADGVLIYEYNYSYNSDGKVDKVDMVDRYAQYSYASDGKVASINFYLKSGAISEKYSYTWSGNNLEIKFTKPTLPNPYQVITYEFINGNIVKDTSKSYTGNDPNEMTSSTEFSYEDFDNALSAFYIASSTRPGYNDALSKNNPRKAVLINKFYDGGTVTQESTTTSVLSYTYNTSNATITSKATTNGTSVVDTVITYDHCD